MPTARRLGPAVREGLRHLRLYGGHAFVGDHRVHQPGPRLQRRPCGQGNGTSHPLVAAGERHASARALVRTPRIGRSYLLQQRAGADQVGPAPRAVIGLPGAVGTGPEPDVEQHHATHVGPLQQRAALDRAERHGHVGGGTAIGDFTGRGIESAGHVERHDRGTAIARERESRAVGPQAVAQRPAMSGAQQPVHHDLLVAGGQAMHQIGRRELRGTVRVGGARGHARVHPDRDSLARQLRGHHVRVAAVVAAPRQQAHPMRQPVAQLPQQQRRGRGTGLHHEIERRHTAVDDGAVACRRFNRRRDAEGAQTCAVLHGYSRPKASSNSKTP